MKSVKSWLVVLGSVSLIFLGACSNSNQVSQPENKPPNAPPVKPAEPTQSSSQPKVSSKGGQVIESGIYHLEFVPEKEANGTHLDFYFQKGDNHEAIANAKVTAQIQLPDGNQKMLDLTYDVAGKHYTSLLPGKAFGQYQVKITANINAEKVTGRFSFNQ